MFSKIKSAQQVLSVEFHPGVAYHEASSLFQSITTAMSLMADIMSLQ